jgi:hypothetical protein
MVLQNEVGCRRTPAYGRAAVVWTKINARLQEGRMTAGKWIAVVAIVCMAAGCENMSVPQKGAATGAALGTGIGMVTGGTFGQVVGAGLIGGAIGYIGGAAVDSSRK